jgi:hypothetical protein
MGAVGELRINGVKVFSATKFRDRENLGKVVTRWLREHRDYVILDREVLQSSDNEFHCLSIVFFYHDPSSR